MKKRQVVVKSGGGFGRDSNNSSSMATSSLPAPRGVVRYGECLKNHAANIGGYALDGCREFMASGEEGTGAELVCAACGCHRSYHRQELETQTDRRQVAASSCDYETNFNGR